MQQSRANSESMTNFAKSGSTASKMSHSVLACRFSARTQSQTSRCPGSASAKLSAMAAALPLPNDACSRMHTALSMLSKCASCQYHLARTHAPMLASLLAQECVPFTSHSHAQTFAPSIITITPLLPAESAQHSTMTGVSAKAGLRGQVPCRSSLLWERV